MPSRHLWLCATLGLVACGDDLQHQHPDASISVDVPPGIDAPDAPGFVPPVPFAIPLSVAGPDQLQAVAAGPSGTFYAAGFAAPTLTGEKLVTVIQVSATGALVPGFGTAGVATTAIVSAAGASGEIGIAVQSTGKLVVTATIANAANAADRDVVVVRLDGTTGALDTTFGTGGTALLDLATALDAAQAAQRDGSRGIAVGPADVIYVLGTQRSPSSAGATDSDFAVVRLTVDGVLDATFGVAGKFTHDIQNVNATPRGLRVLADGSLIAAGYASTPASGSTTQVVLYKVTPAGILDPTFATGGLFHEVVLATQTEAYNVAVHGDQLVTAGYGRSSSAAGATNDFVSLRFDAMTGERDLTWGDAVNGAVLIDPSGAMLGNNCRNAVALPAGKTLLIGSAGPASSAAQDAVVVVLDADGHLDPAYGDGSHAFPLGANLNDQFWGAAVSGTNVLIVGYKGGGATPTDAINDDAWGVLLPLQ